MADNIQYLKYEAESMLDFLKDKLTENGRFTDQLYNGSNMSIILETLSALFECFTYQLNFQAAETTFNGVQIYENMLKIVSPLGYKARASIAPTILGNITANVYINSVFSSIEMSAFTENDTLGKLVELIASKISLLTSPKILSKDLGFTDTSGAIHYTLFQNVAVYPEYINATNNNIFYWTKRYGITEGIINYLKYLWNLPTTLYKNGDVTNVPASELQITMSDIANMLNMTEFDKIKTLPLIPNGVDSIPANLRVSSKTSDNFITAANGTWNSIFITNSTIGEQFEKYNISNLNVETTNISDKLLYAVVYDSSNILESAEIYKCVSSLRNYKAVDKVFEYYVDIDKTITIRFGDGIYGAQLPQKKSLTLFYVINEGESGMVSKTSFSLAGASIQKSSVIAVTSDNSTGYVAKDLEDYFVYEVGNARKVSSEKCNFVSLLLQSTGQNFIPKMDVYFNPLEASSKFQDIETVEDIRELAPLYNRTNDRIITRNDLYTVLKKNYVQYIYDVAIMNNYDYMAKFYSWLYKYDKISKDIAIEGYKFADSCDFNNVYCWCKGYTKYPINDFIKKSIDRDLVSKKVLTSELIFLDAINTNFYPYVGSIIDDINWIIDCASKYQFLIKNNNSTDINYKRWSRIQKLFDRDSAGNIIRKPTKAFLNYIFSADNNEIKFEIQAVRDANANENEATIKSNILEIINSYFNIENRKLGEIIKLNEINSQVAKISGIKKFATIKQRNMALYASTIPTVNPPVIYQDNYETGYEVTYNTNNLWDNSAKIYIKLNTDIFDNNGELKDVTIDWILFDKTLGKEIKTLKTLNDQDLNIIETKGNKYNSSNDTADIKTINEAVSRIMLYFNAPKPQKINESDAESVNYNNSAIFDYYNKDEPGYNIKKPDYSHTYQIYAKCSREDIVNNEPVKLVTYTNKLDLTFVQYTGKEEPSTFRFISTLDNTNNLSILLENSGSGQNATTSDKLWQITDSIASLSFCKWTDSLIGARDFENIGSGHIALEDFCFPTLYQDITSIITVKDDESDTIGIEY